MARHNIQSLPAELHTECFQCLNFKDIQNVRLTCRQFCDASSSLLVDSVRVYMTSASLSRLEEISHHPLIGKGVQEVELNASYYDENCWRTYREFAALQREMFGNHDSATSLTTYLALEESVNGMPGMPSSKLLALLEAGKIAVGDICHDYGQNGHYKKRFIRKAEEEWNRRYEDQETVRTDDSHVDRIVAALARMPRARRIVITDDYRRHRFFDLFKDREPKLYPKQWIFDNIGSARHSAVDFLIKIPCALGAAGIFPIQYFVEFTSLLDLPDLHVSESQRRQISLCMQRVKEICFLSAGLEDGFARVPTTQNHGLISAYIDTNSIEDLALSFEETLMDDSATHSLHAILPSPTAVWPQLRTLFLGDTVSVHWDTELLPMFERHPRIKTVGFRRVCLISGKWRDCFNFLRGLKLKDFSAHRCRGAEMDEPLGEGPDGEELVEDNFCDQLFSFDIQQYVTRKTNGNPFVVDGGRSNPKYFEFL